MCLKIMKMAPRKESHTTEKIGEVTICIKSMKKP